MKSDSLGISNKMFLKVDVEGGKVYFKKSKDGPEDKYFVHNKSMLLLFYENNEMCESAHVFSNLKEEMTCHPSLAHDALSLTMVKPQD